jgi:hypothetical protein
MRERPSCAVNLGLFRSQREGSGDTAGGRRFSQAGDLSILGSRGGLGLVDAIADPNADPQTLSFRRISSRLSVSPAGTGDGTTSPEMLGGREHTRHTVQTALTQRPNRIVAGLRFPPALMASPRPGPSPAR